MVPVTRDHSNHDLKSFARQINKGGEESRLIEVEPLPDEPALAHVHRWLQVGSYRTRADLDRALQREISAIPGVGAPGTFLYRIARASHLSPSQYARRHSMLGALFPAVGSADECAYGDEVEGGAIAAAHWRMPRKGAFVCPICIGDDLRSRPISWFRRAHQLIGFDWCPVHGEPLACALDEDAFKLLPHVLRGEAQLSDPVVDVRLPEGGFIRRFVDITLGLLARTRPAPSATLHQVLRRRASDLGVDGTGWRKRRLLSDLVVDIADEDWLLRHVPHFHHKFAGRQFLRIDKILSQDDSAAEGAYYALALAALYDSPADALAAVDGSCGRSTGSPLSDRDSER